VTLKLHGIVRAGHPCPAGPAMPRLVTWEDLAVIVSEHPVGRALTQQDAMANLNLLSAAVRSGPVLPLRFGTTAENDDAARTEVLAHAAPDLRAQLDRLDGLAEIHVYLSFDEEAGLRAILEQDGYAPPIAAGLDLAGRVQLGEQIALRLIAWRRAQADALLAPLSALATGETALTEGEHTEERRAFLIPAERLDEASSAVAALPAEHDAQFAGPLPAYSFLTGPPTPPDAEPTSRWGW
jgi:hypothetical protein